MHHKTTCSLGTDTVNRLKLLDAASFEIKSLGDQVTQTTRFGSMTAKATTLHEALQTAVWIVLIVHPDYVKGTQLWYVVFFVEALEHVLQQTRCGSGSLAGYQNPEDCHFLKLIFVQSEVGDFGWINHGCLLQKES